MCLMCRKLWWLALMGVGGKNGLKIRVSTVRFCVPAPRTVRPYSVFVVRPFLFSGRILVSPVILVG